MSDNREEAEEKMAKAIFISGDGWLAVFDLLEPSQLGLGIALVSHRFDFYVDEHFKTRRWALKFMEIKAKFEADGTNGWQIVNCDGKPLPTPQKAMPKKVVGFKSISIKYIDQNAIAFLHRFRQFFAFCPINLVINTNCDRTLESILRNIWPMIAKNICAIELPDPEYASSNLRQFVPSILNDCPSLRVINSHSVGFIAEFPYHESAKTSNGHALAKWLFTPRPDNVPKVLKCWLPMWYTEFDSSMEDFKAAFANASSPVNFIVVVWISRPFAFPAQFDQTNEVTREQLTFKRIGKSIRHLLLIRCPIVRDTDKWAKWEKEAIDWQFNDQWNRIDIQINNEREMDVDTGPSDQEKK
ncbi:hypothetical protein niasHT_017718 [Heterodera trifolii]|uniref:Uncharacterized protein n=1 Tax=Heterodera trifolii TaxID=157864 RepID=A0ABD2L6S2_9BILA